MGLHEALKLIHLGHSVLWTIHCYGIKILGQTIQILQYVEIPNKYILLSLNIVLRQSNAVYIMLPKFDYVNENLFHSYSCDCLLGKLYFLLHH